MNTKTIINSISVLLVLLAPNSHIMAETSDCIPANKVNSFTLDQGAIDAIVSTMNSERDNAEKLVKRDTSITVDIKPLAWSEALAIIAKDRIEKTLAAFCGATQHIDTGVPVAENLLPYGIRKSTGSVAYAAGDLVKGWSGIADACSAEQWDKKTPYLCGEKAANSFVALDPKKGSYKRACDNTRMHTCGHYGNIIETGYASVGCAKAEVPHKTDPDITNGGWSCVFE